MIKAKLKINKKTVVKVKPYNTQINTNEIDEINSTTTYWNEIGFLHFLHFPFKNKQEIIGILSYQTIFFLHFGQCDLPPTTPLSFGSLTMQTFAKLPQSAPKINTKTMSTDVFDYNLKLEVTWIIPSINTWTIKTAS